MKKLLTTIALLGAITTTASAEVNFQKVYDMDGNAQNIITNISKAVLIDRNVQGDALTGKAIVRCLISEKKMGGLLPEVRSKYRGDLLVEAKDGRYRVTFSDMKFVAESDAERFMNGLSMNKEIAESCVADFEKFSMTLQNKAKSFASNW
jgi:hypothetical protein